LTWLREIYDLQYHLHREIDKYVEYRINHSGIGKVMSFSEHYTPFVFSVPIKVKNECCIDGCDKLRGGRSVFCWMHKSRRFKQRNPLSYIYSKLKYNAKVREIEFTITLRFFRLFCWYNDYDVYRGRRNNDYNIDRVDNKEGYARENIQILTKEENVKKYHEIDKCPF